MSRMMRAAAFAVGAWIGFASLAAPAPVMVDRVVPASPAEVYRAWTTPEGFREALGLPLRIELRPGGKYEIEFVPDAPEGQRGSEGCSVLSFLPERLVSFTWNAPPQFGALRDERTFVVVTMNAVGPSATKVSLAHQGFGDGERWAAVREYFAKAWPAVLDAMGKAFEAKHGFGAEAPGQTPQFVYTIRLARADLLKDGGTPEEQKALEGHFEYLKGLVSRGVVVLAGRTADADPLGTIIFEARDEREAESIMNGDPAVAAKVFVAEVRPFRVVLQREAAPPSALHAKETP